MNRVFRGDIYYADIGRGIGHEQSGRRPCIIVGNDTGNLHSPVVEVVYMTGAGKKPLPTHVEIGSAKIPCTALCDQIDTLDKRRLSEYIGHVTVAEMGEIEQALRISLGI